MLCVPIWEVFFFPIDLGFDSIDGDDTAALASSSFFICEIKISVATFACRWTIEVDRAVDL